MSEESTEKYLTFHEAVCESLNGIEGFTFHHVAGSIYESQYGHKVSIIPHEELASWVREKFEDKGEIATEEDIENAKNELFNIRVEYQLDEHFNMFCEFFYTDYWFKY